MMYKFDALIIIQKYYIILCMHSFPVKKLRNFHLLFISHISHELSVKTLDIPIPLVNNKCIEFISFI